MEKKSDGFFKIYNFIIEILLVLKIPDSLTHPLTH